jgi:hypothetical protein
VEGIKQLRQRCNDNLTSLMRGLDGKKLGHAWSKDDPLVSMACNLTLLFSALGRVQSRGLYGVTHLVGRADRRTKHVCDC